MKHRPTLEQDYIKLALDLGLIEMTQPDSPRSPTQKYRLTEKGIGYISSKTEKNRKIYARAPLAKEKGFKAGDFSYNTGSLRCPTCDGTGKISLDVQFLPDVDIPFLSLTNPQSDFTLWMSSPCFQFSVTSSKTALRSSSLSTIWM